VQYLINPPPKVGDRWLKRFFQRHPEYKVRKRYTLDMDHKKAHEPDTILDWFQRLKIKIDLYGIVEEDI
jgi:hypothetical protein